MAVSSARAKKRGDTVPILLGDVIIQVQTLETVEQMQVYGSLISATLAPLPNPEGIPFG